MRPTNERFDVAFVGGVALRYVKCVKRNAYTAQEKNKRYLRCWDAATTATPRLTTRRYDKYVKETYKRDLHTSNET